MLMSKKAYAHIHVGGVVKQCIDPCLLSFACVDAVTLAATHPDADSEARRKWRGATGSRPPRSRSREETRQDAKGRPSSAPITSDGFGPGPSPKARRPEAIFLSPARARLFPTRPITTYNAGEGGRVARLAENAVNIRIVVLVLEYIVRYIFKVILHFLF